MAADRKQAAPPPLGGISLLVVFAVLCLTVFALLSLSTVMADTRLADAAAQAVEDYYAADVSAQETLARLRCGELPDGVTREDGNVYSYQCPISDTQSLSVEVRVEADGSYDILRWQAGYDGLWLEGEGPEFWDGEDMELFDGAVFE